MFHKLVNMVSGANQMCKMKTQPIIKFIYSVLELSKILYSLSGTRTFLLKNMTCQLIRVPVDDSIVFERMFVQKIKT